MYSLTLLRVCWVNNRFPVFPKFGNEIREQKMEICPVVDNRPKQGPSAA